MPIDAFKICLNVHSGIDDSAFFKDLLEKNLRNVEVEVDYRDYTNIGKTQYIQSKLDSCGDLFIPADADEFIEYNLEEESKKLLTSPERGLHGRLVDMVDMVNGKIHLKNPRLDIPINESFPNETDLCKNLRVVTNKIVLIKPGNTLTDGHHYYPIKSGEKLNPTHYFKVRHYCWTSTTSYDRTNRSNSNLPAYRRVVDYIRENTIQQSE
jgi:hypothetical protein